MAHLRYLHVREREHEVTNAANTSPRIEPTRLFPSCPGQSPDDLHLCSRCPTTQPSACDYFRHQHNLIAGSIAGPCSDMSATERRRIHDHSSAFRPSTIVSEAQPEESAVHFSSRQACGISVRRRSRCGGRDQQVSHSTGIPFRNGVDLSGGASTAVIARRCGGVRPPERRHALPVACDPRRR